VSLEHILFRVLILCPLPPYVYNMSNENTFYPSHTFYSESSFCAHCPPIYEYEWWEHILSSERVLFAALILRPLPPCVYKMSSENTFYLEPSFCTYCPLDINTNRENTFCHILWVIRTHSIQDLRPYTPLYIWYESWEHILSHTMSSWEHILFGALTICPQSLWIYNEAYHVRMRHVTDKWASRMRDIKYTYESCRIWTSPVTCEWVTAHTNRANEQYIVYKFRIYI